MYIFEFLCSFVRKSMEWNIDKEKTCMKMESKFFERKGD